MAINLPSNLYSGEAERINSMPHVQFQTQLMQQKAAKDEAIDQYYKKLPETINQKGVRDQEVPLINGAKNDIQEFYMKNKAAIVNPKIDNGAAQFALQKKYRDASTLISESQNRAKTDLELGKMRFEGDKNYVFQDPDFLHKVEAHSKPVGMEGSESLDLATVAVPPPPFDQTKYTNDFKGIKWNEGMPLVSPAPNRVGYDMITTPKTLPPESINTVRNMAAVKLDTDKSFSNYIKNTLAKSPERLDELNKLFQEKTGHPIENDYDIASAYSLSVLPKPEEKVDVVENKEYTRRQKLADEKEMARFRNSLNTASQERLIKLRQQAQDSGDAETNNLWVDNYLSNIEKENKPSLGNIFFGGGKKVSPDPVLYKALNNPDDVIIKPNGKWQVIYYKINPDKTISDEVDNSKSGIFTREQIKLALGYKSAGKKQLTQEMLSNNPLDLDL